MSASLEYEGVTLTVWDDWDGVATAIAVDANTRAETGWKLVSHAIVTTLAKTTRPDWRRVEMVEQRGYAVSVIYARRKDYDPNG